MVAAKKQQKSAVTVIRRQLSQNGYRRGSFAFDVC